VILRRGGRAVVVLALALGPTACSSCKDGGGADAGGAEAAAAGSAATPVVVRTPEDERAWTVAKDGEEDDLVRLAQREGASGLAERATDPAWRTTALRAMAYAEGFAQLPALGAAAATGTEEEATLAAASAATLAARKRAPVDPEDAEELADGCGALLGAAKDASRPKVVRVDSIRALRMLSDQPGCVNPADVPHDLDAK
jgi:hypothetical protein